ncbi:pseudouridine synthase [Limimaricola cinnabarinus]|nr:pseudouridine synthase [Limimaricola cinnabarinus]
MDGQERHPRGDRIAKVLSRAGVASRREAERMIEDGRVKVNGERIFSPALNVTAKDRITVDGAPLAAPEPARLWLYHKPAGLVTSASDEKGRKTVFDELPEDMPRVMSVGRLDLNSEGLLLLTNDGELKRKLELPSTGWLRRYRVRINGSVSEDKLDRLRKGISVEGVDYQPMQVTFDRQQGANAWLTIGLREGKNREIRRAMAELEVTVNRLIRISYGPFQIGNLEPGEVEEIRPKVLREQLGEGDSPKVQRRRPDGTPGAKPGLRGTGTGTGPKGPGGARKQASETKRSTGGTGRVFGAKVASDGDRPGFKSGRAGAKAGARTETPGSRTDRTGPKGGRSGFDADRSGPKGDRAARGGPKGGPGGGSGGGRGPKPPKR